MPETNSKTKESDVECIVTVRVEDPRALLDQIEQQLQEELHERFEGFENVTDSDLQMMLRK